MEVKAVHFVAFVICLVIGGGAGEIAFIAGAGFWMIFIIYAGVTFICFLIWLFYLVPYYVRASEQQP